MLGGFSAVLGGGRGTLEKDFNLELTGDLPQWTLALDPKAPQMKKYLRDIAIHGSQNEPRCIVVTQPARPPTVVDGVSRGIGLLLTLTLLLILLAVLWGVVTLMGTAARTPG